MPYKIKRKSQNIENSKTFCVICSIQITKRGRPTKGKSEIKPNTNLISILSSISQNSIISAAIEYEIKEKDENLVICHSCESLFERNKEISEKIKFLQDEQNKIKLEIKNILNSVKNEEFSLKYIKLRQIISNELGFGIVKNETIEKDEKIGYDLPLENMDIDLPLEAEINKKIDIQSNENEKDEPENENNDPIDDDDDSDDTVFDFPMSKSDQEEEDDDVGAVVNNQPYSFRTTRKNSKIISIKQNKDDKNKKEKNIVKRPKRSDFYSLFGTKKNPRKKKLEEEVTNDGPIIKKEADEISDAETDEIQPLWARIFAPKLYKKVLIKCFLCNRNFIRIRDLVGHVKTHVALTCNFCKTLPEFPTIKEFNIHIMKIHSEKSKYICDLCQKVTKDSLSLYHHKYSAHVDLKLKCDICDNGELFKSKQKLSYHKSKMHSEEGNRKMLCPLCGKELSDIKSYNRHMASVHLKLEKNKYSCDLCEFFTYHDGVLRTHKENVHCNTREFLCSSCGSAFKSNFNLRNHKRRMHNSNPRFKCEECGRCFTEKNRFDDHLYSHIVREEWPLVCRHCPKRFYRKQYLKHHEALHSGVRDIICDICQKGFSTISGLYTHKYIVHKIRNQR